MTKGGEMDRERYQRLRALVHEAGSLSGDARARFLDSACGGDVGMRQEVERLLGDAGARTAGFLAKAPAGDEPPLPEGTRLGHVRLGPLLGSGAMGTVYRGFDERLGQEVAVKVIHPRLLALPEIATRVAREAELGRRVVDEHVVRTLDHVVATHEGREVSALVMELVEGRTLATLIDELGSVPESLLREISRQIAIGLDAIHRAGAVHRDLKPENVMITRDHRVRIMDLGVAKVLAATSVLTMEGQFVGSLAYAAPEQAGSAPVGPPADLYSLGCLIHEMAAGEPPFRGETPVDLMQKHLTRPPPRLGGRAAGVSHFLAEVCAVLLAKRPEDRFPSAGRLAEVLAEGEHGAWWLARRQRDDVDVPVARATALHGRDRESALLDAAWAEARAGRGAVVLLEAEAGLGKTRLVDTFLETVRPDQAHRIYAAYADDGTCGIREALSLRWEGDDLDAALRRCLPRRPHLATALAAFLRGGPGAPSATGAADLLAELAQGLAADLPLAFVVDDLHFSDADARTLVRALARAAAGHRILLLVTARSGAAEEELRVLRAIPGVTHVQLARLGVDEVRQILEEAWGDPTAALAHAPALATRSDGIPFHLFHLLKGGTAEGMVPGALHESLAARIEALDPEARSVLEAAAVQGVAFDTSLLARVCGSSPLRLLQVLARLEREHGLVRTEGNECRLDHHLLQAAIYERMPAPQRARYHALTADAVEGAESDGAAAYRVVYHHLRGSRPDAAAPFVLRALKHLAVTFQPAAAVDVAERALALGAFAADRERLPVLLRLGRRLQVLGRMARARPVVEEALAAAERLGDPAGRAEALLQRGYLALAVGDAEAARRAGEEAGALAASLRLESMRAEAYGVEAQARTAQGAHDEAVRLNEAALGLARQLKDTRQEARALANLGLAEQSRARFDESERNLRLAIDLFERIGESPASMPSVVNLGNVLQQRGRLGEALETYHRALRMATDLGYAEGQAVSWINVGEVRMRCGDLDGAGVALERARTICRRMGARHLEASVLHAEGVLARFLGDLRGSAKRLEEALALRRAGGIGPGVAAAQIELARLDRARARLDEALAIARECGDVNAEVGALALSAALPGGDAGAAEEALVRGRPQLRFDVAMEASFLLWRATGERRHLKAAREILEEASATAPPEWREAMRVSVPLHREIEGEGRREGGALPPGDV